MTPELFCEQYPYLFHMAEADTWESIKRYGLLSTSAILDLLKITGKERKDIESSCRKDYVLIEDKKHGKFLIRDNGPLPLKKLQASLIDMTPEQFYKELNKKVFFWPTEQRVKDLLGARRYRNRKHTVIKVRSDLLLKHYQTKIHLSRINSGAAVYQPTPRGKSTFVPFIKWDEDVGPRSGKLKEPIAEIAVRYGVDKITEIAVEVNEMHGTKLLKKVWHNKSFKRDGA